MVFQNYALFPHLAVAENVAFGLKARRAARPRRAPRSRRFLELVHLTDFADRSVRALSGGQQQRVAVARALAVGPKLLLLDEPFSALDRKLRETMQIELRRLLRELGTTAMFVTHDQEEALTMSDRIAVMNRGAIEQIATPRGDLPPPATAFTLEFVGLSSRLARQGRAAAPAGRTVDTPLGLAARPRQLPIGTEVLVALRPERIRSTAQATTRSPRRLRDAVFQGSKVQLHFEAPRAISCWSRPRTCRRRAGARHGDDSSAGRWPIR